MNIPKLLAIGGLMVSPLALSAGFQVNEQSVSSMARANAGRGAVGDNAADIGINPAISSVYDQQQLSLTLSYVNPNINFEGSNTELSTGLSRNASSSVTAYEIAPSPVVPGFFYVMPFDSRFSFGLSVSSYYGMETKYPKVYAASEFAGETGIKAIYVTPSITYNFNEYVSVGAGFSYVHGSGKINATASESFNAVTGIPVGAKLLDIEGSGSDFGWVVGGLWNIDDHSRLGVSYRSKVTVTANVDATMLTEGIVDRKGTMDLQLPKIIEAGYFNQLTDKVALALGFQYTGWDVFKVLEVNVAGPGGGNKPFKDEYWHDSYRFSIGGDYQLSNVTTLHAGIAHDRSSIPSERLTLTIPDSNRNWYSVGATMDFQEAGIIDLAFTYINGDHVDVSETNGVTSVSGKFAKLDALIFSLGYNYRF